MEVTKANLATYLAGLAPSATPYPIEITETVASDWRGSYTAGMVGNIINNNTPSGVYLDLGLTIIPHSVTSMNGTFNNSTSLTTAPVIPNSVTSMYDTFYNCTALTIAPVIPNSVTDMSYTFSFCTSLTKAQGIPNSVTNMYYAFRGCSSLHTIQNFAVDVDNCNMTDAFSFCPALANIYVTTLSESSWHLLHTDTDATGTDYTIYNPDGTVAGSGTVAGISQVLTLYGKSDELVISANITPTLAEETATSQVQWHKSGLPYDDELMIFNAKNPDTVISNFITVNRAGEEFLGNSATATTATTATLATQANAIKPLGNAITLPATPTSVTKIIKIATVNYDYAGIFNISCNGASISDGIKVYINGFYSTESGVRVLYGKNNYAYGIKKIVVTSDTPDSIRQIYAEIVTRATYPSTTVLGVVETNYGTLTPSMVEVASVEGTVVDSLSLSYRRGDISSYQHVFTKNIIGNVTGNVTGNLTGNATTATKLETARKINGVDFDGSANITVADSTKAPTSHASSAVTYGVSSEANYGHAKASTVAGTANGTASKGTTPTVFAQSNHVHPLQTSVSGNAGTADKWKTARNFTISDADGTNTGTAVSVDGSENETLKLPATIKANITGNASTATEIKPLGNSITLPATPTLVTRIIKVASVDWTYAGTVNFRCVGGTVEDNVKITISGGDSRVSGGVKVVYGKYSYTRGAIKIIVTSEAMTKDSTKNLYIEVVASPTFPLTTTLGVVETNNGTFTPSMTEVSSVEGTVLDSLELSYQRGEISSYQHVFTKNIGFEKLLWTNQSPNASFASQTVTLAETISNFTFYFIIYKAIETDNNYYSTGFIPTNLSACMLGNFSNSVFIRTTGVPSGTSISFGSSSSAGTNPNRFIIPYKIYGIR